MKLSEAMRAGSRQTVKGTSTYFPGIQDGKLMACALGAAWLAVHGTVAIAECNYEAVIEEWPELLEKRTVPENIDIRADNLWWVVATLNDEAGWSREQIADWLEQEGL